MDFFDKTGKMALGSRLRVLSTRMSDDAAKIYELYGNDFKPKWFPVFFILAKEGEKSVTGLASEIAHTQPSVTKIIKEMKAAGLVEEKAARDDKRKSIIGLTDKANGIAESIWEQCEDVDIVVEKMLAEATHNLWEAMDEWEYLLDQKSLLRRVQDQKKLRTSGQIQVVPYEPRYQAAFRALNEEWISRYFEMEPSDYAVLDHPREYILDRGGKVFVALYKGEPVGVCALLPGDTGSRYDFQLAKMAVSPKAQGKNIGWMLGTTALKEARQLGASKIYLESHTSLEAAINLYQKLGFQKVSGIPSPYKRVNIQMDLDLTRSD